MEFPFGETVTVLRAAKVTDPYSGEKTGHSWDDPEETEYENVAAWQVQLSTDDIAGRPIAMVLPAGSDVRVNDRIKWRDTVYELDGEPFDWKSPFTGWEPGVQVHLGEVVTWPKSKSS